MFIRSLSFLNLAIFSSRTCILFFWFKITEFNCITLETWGYITLIAFSSYLFWTLSLLYNWEIFTILSFNSLSLIPSIYRWTIFVSSFSSWRAFLRRILFSFCNNFIRLLRSLIYDPACLKDYDLSSSSLNILAIISLFCVICLKRESFELIFKSFISFSLAVSSPCLLDNLDWDKTLDSYLSAIYTWHFPIFMFGWALTLKNSLFFTFSISMLIKSFYTASIMPITPYLDFYFLPITKILMFFFKKDSGIVNIVAALNCLADLIGGSFIVWLRI